MPKKDSPFFGSIGGRVIPIDVSMDVHGGDKSRLANELQAAINMVG